LPYLTQKLSRNKEKDLWTLSQENRRDTIVLKIVPLPGSNHQTVENDDTELLINRKN